MQRTNLRKVGGSVTLAVPPALLDLLSLSRGAKVGLSVDRGRLVVEPHPQPHLYPYRALGRFGPLATATPGRTGMGRCSGRWPRAVMKRGDIYLVSLDPTEGHAQRGYRPVLIVSPAAFNDATKLPVILPITTGGKFARHIGFAVSISGIEMTGAVRCDQSRMLDLQARKGRKVGTLPPALMEEVLAKVSTIFE